MQAVSNTTNIDGITLSHNLILLIFLIFFSHVLHAVFTQGASNTTNIDGITLSHNLIFLIFFSHVFHAQLFTQAASNTTELAFSAILGIRFFAPSIVRESRMYSCTELSFSTCLIFVDSSSKLAKVSPTLNPTKSLVTSMLDYHMVLVVIRSAHVQFSACAAQIPEEFPKKYYLR